MRKQAREAVSGLHSVYARALMVTTSPPCQMPDIPVSPVGSIPSQTITFWLVELFHPQRRRRIHIVRADVDSSTTGINDQDLVSRLGRNNQNVSSELNGKDNTSSNSPDFVLVTQKLKLASPSVTKDTRERASSSVNTEAWTTEFRRNSCSRPSHPLGCESMRSKLCSSVSHNISPMGSHS